MLNRFLGLHVPMPARDNTEAHRASTTLELFYDLVIVISIAVAVSHLHHAFVADHIAHGMLTFLMVFWSIMWAWMSFTWFASSYDSDDAPYRIAVFIQLIGSLIMAAGIGEVFEHNNFRVIAFGYIIMRLALVALWIRVIKSNSQDKVGAIRHAIGIILCQLGWIVLIFLVPSEYLLVGFWLLVLCEQLVPYYGGLRKQSVWHREHIIERYGLLTIIVLGETLLASGHAIKALNEHFSPLLMCTVIGGLLITFSMWWFYFDEHEHKRLQYSNRGYMWSYGHILVFISISTVGAGLEVMNDKIGGHAEVSLHVANAMVAVPTAIFMVSMWLLHDLFSKRSFEAKLLYPAAAMLVLTTPFFEYGTFAVGLLLLLTLAIRLKMDTASSPTEYVTNL